MARMAGSGGIRPKVVHMRRGAGFAPHSSRDDDGRHGWWVSEDVVEIIVELVDGGLKYTPRSNGDNRVLPMTTMPPSPRRRPTPVNADTFQEQSTLSN